ncbi:MAG: twin-arginine translocation signal domain-containing protein, partial [Candidatus Nanopelagicales bacterium]
MGKDLVRVTDISRRGFLGGLAAGAAVIAISSPAQALMPRAGEPMPTIVVRRREDLLRLVITPVNMTIDKSTGRVAPTGDVGLLVVNFGPQSVVEKAYGSGQTPPAGSTPARLSGDSQLRFQVDAPVGLTLSGLLSWAEHDPYLNQIGRYLDGEVMPSNLPVGKPPNSNVTMIEMPWWLVLSPNRLSAWTEQVRAKTDGGRSEVFHTRLATYIPGDGLTEDPTFRTLRGIWIKDPSATYLLSNPNLVIAEGQPG